MLTSHAGGVEDGLIAELRGRRGLNYEIEAHRRARRVREARGEQVITLLTNYDGVLVDLVHGVTRAVNHIPREPGPFKTAYAFARCHRRLLQTQGVPGPLHATRLLRHVAAASTAYVTRSVCQSILDPIGLMSYR